MKRVHKITLDLGMYVSIVALIVFGLPKLLSYYLNSPYPLAAITSSSMWPSLKEGDLIFIKGIKAEEMRVGDIVVFRDSKNDHFVIHRVIKINAETFVTKGDANFREDEPIRFENLIGKTFTVRNRNVRIPYLGSITVFASNLKEESENRK